MLDSFRSSQDTCLLRATYYKIDDIGIPMMLEFDKKLLPVQFQILDSCSNRFQEADLVLYTYALIGSIKLCDPSCQDSRAIRLP